MTSYPEQTTSEMHALIAGVLELLPVPVLLVDSETLGVTFANGAADRLVGGRFPRGQDRFGGDGLAYVPRDPETGAPLAREETATWIAARTGRRVEGRHFDFETPAGTLSLVASADLLPAIGDMGASVIVSFEDVSELSGAQRTAEDAVALLDTLFDAAPVGLAYLDRDLRYVRLNEALATINRVPLADHIGRTPTEVLHEFDPAGVELLRGVIDSGRPVAGLEIEVTFPDAPDDRKTLICAFYPVFGPEGETTGLGAAIVDITDRKTAESALERALMSEREARAAAEAAARRARFLAEASVILDRTLDYGETLRSVAGLAVPSIADWCAVDVLEGGSLRNVALAHLDPDAADHGRATLHELTRQSGPSPGPAEVVRTGESWLVGDLAAEREALAPYDDAPEHLALLHELGTRSLMVVPMVSRGRMLGAITFAGAESGRRFADEDVLLAEDVARRAAIAVDNARLYSERAHIARTLQDSLLPPSLPSIPGVETAARYVAAGEGIEVGGDFYDLYDLGDGSWSVVMGDVCGKGADAAALTALARYTLRATVDAGTAPSEALAILNDAVLRQRGDGRFITVAYARLTTAGDGHAVVTLASGGHPAPIVLRADGSATPVGHPGTLLGVVDDPALHDATFELGPGDVLLLYTDGVTEAHAPDTLLEVDDLVRIIEGCAGGNPTAVIECVEDEVRALGGGTPGDDIAMLALRMRP